MGPLSWTGMYTSSGGDPGLIVDWATVEEGVDQPVIRGGGFRRQFVRGARDGAEDGKSKRAASTNPSSKEGGGGKVGAQVSR